MDTNDSLQSLFKMGTSLKRKNLLKRIFIANTYLNIFEPGHEISNNEVCATSKGSDQPAHMRSLIRALARRLIAP